MNTRNSPGNKVQVGTIDCTPTWESLVPWFFEVLENGDGKPESKKIIREQITRMAQVADKHVAYVKSQEVTSENLLARIVEIAKPKFCGDTNIMLNAKAKLIGYTGEKEHLNNLVGTTANPFPTSEDTSGMVGFYLYPGQHYNFPDDRLNVEANHIRFIE